MAVFFLAMVLTWFYLFFWRMGKKRADAGVKARVRRMFLGSKPRRGASSSSSSGSFSPSSTVAGSHGWEAGAAGAHGASPLHVVQQHVNPVSRERGRGD